MLVLTSIQSFWRLYVEYFAFVPVGYGRADIEITQLLRVSSYNRLQVQNSSGDWIGVPPILGTFVINIGKGECVCSVLVHFSCHPLDARRVSTAGLEVVTCGLTRATSRYSIPVSKNINQNVQLNESRLNRTYTFSFRLNRCSYKSSLVTRLTRSACVEREAGGCLRE